MRESNRDRIDTKEKETSAYQTGPFDDVKVQEALTIIAVYAAQMDYQDCEADVKRLETILERHQAFAARKEEIFSLINKFTNEMEICDPHKALEIAADVLTPEQKKAGFELAVEVILPDRHLIVTDDIRKTLDTLKVRLAISDEFAAQAIGNKIEGKRK